MTLPDDKKPEASALTIYIRHLNEVNFDLGDWFARDVSIFPRKDSLESATKFIEFSAFERERARAEKAEAELGRAKEAIGKLRSALNSGHTGIIFILFIFAVDSSQFAIAAKEITAKLRAPLEAAGKALKETEEFK